jgi:hypothetical protein
MISYGLFVGFTSFVFTKLLPQPAGSIILFGFWSLQLSSGAVTYWRRTGLPFMTAAMVHGAVMSLCLAVLAAIGRPFHDMTMQSWVLFVGAAISGMLLTHIESRINTSRVKQCTEFLEGKTVWDILIGRHIPQLRDGGH